MTQEKHLEAFGNEEPDDGDSDFGDEHANTVVDKDLGEGRDVGETESPGGWDGMDQDGPP